MKKILVFSFRGNSYQVDEKGRINANGIGHFSGHWIFLGGSQHHWHNHITVQLADAFTMPGLLDGCLGWDSDHGTTRQWSGRYHGRIPRISGAHIEAAGFGAVV